MCEVQSDKANVEITSPYEGTLVRYLVEEGEVAVVGKGLCLIQLEEETDSEEPKPLLSQGEKETVLSSKPHPMNPSYQTPTEKPQKDILITPSARHFAKHNNVDLSSIAPGSGKNGRIEKQDILSFMETKAKETSSDQGPPGGSIEVELRQTRLAMWKSMVKASIAFKLIFASSFY